MSKGFGKILCPVVFEPNSAVALKRAAFIANTSGGDLAIAHIVNNPLDRVYHQRIMEAWGTEADIQRACTGKPFCEFSELVLDVAKLMLKEFASEHIGDVPYDVHVALDTHTYRRINELAEECGADLIVMSTHGRTGPKRLYFGSVAENIVRRAPCSVFIVRSSTKR